MAKRKRPSRPRKRQGPLLPPDTFPRSAFSLILGIRYLVDQLLQSHPMSRKVLGRRIFAGYTTGPPTTSPPTTPPPKARKRKRKAAKKGNRRRG